MVCHGNLQDSREVSKLLTAWETSQPSVRTTLTRTDKLRKSATDLVETEHEYVMVMEKKKEERQIDSI